jgi:MerR family transcriptional regulator/heat shock protein HspR
MTRPIIPRDLVAHQLAVSPKVLVRYESLGLVQITHEGQMEGYEPSQVRRIGKIVSFQRDLGVNLAGIEVILRLYDQMSELHHQLDDLARELCAILDAEESETPSHT